MVSSTFYVRRVALVLAATSLVVALVWCVANPKASGQARNASLSLSLTSATPGEAILLELRLNAAPDLRPAALQWSVLYPGDGIATIEVSAGEMATAAAKTISCAGAAGVYTCILAGMNTNEIADGVVARLKLTPTGSGLSRPVEVRVENLVAASGDGSAIPLAPENASVTVGVAE